MIVVNVLGGTEEYGDQVWNGKSEAWIYLAAVAVGGALLWYLIARRRRAGS